MKGKCLIIAVFAFFALTRCSLGQSHVERPSLCELQKSSAAGEHRTVEVEGVYLQGMDGAYLVVADCPGQATLVVLEEIKDHKNVDRMTEMADKPNKARGVYGDGTPILVVIEGEFYGPPGVDQGRPDSTKGKDHAGWDSKAQTKLVVSAIRSVKELPADDPCKAPKSNPTEWPCFQKD